MAVDRGDRLRGLPPTFTYSEARRQGLSDRMLYRLRDEGALEVIDRGLFRRTDADELTDLDLLTVAVRAPSATLCLATALARHGLTDEIPPTIDVALPRGTYRPRIDVPVTWHYFHPATFDIGRDTVLLDKQTSIGLYNAPRCIIDAARLRHQEGAELVYGALRRWLNRRGSSPSELLAMASNFPRAERTLRDAIEILL